MTKTYFCSPIIAIICFFGFIFAEMLIGHLSFSPLEWKQGQIISALTLATLVFGVAWLGLIIRITDRTITRILFFVFIKTHNLSDVVAVEDKTDSDALGKQGFTEIRFKNGDKWNLLAFSEKNMREIKDILRQHAN